MFSFCKNKYFFHKNSVLQNCVIFSHKLHIKESHHNSIKMILFKKWLSIHILVLKAHGIFKLQELLGYQNHSKLNSTFFYILTIFLFIFKNIKSFANEYIKLVVSTLKGSILGLYMGVWAEPHRISPFMNSLFN